MTTFATVLRGRCARDAGRPLVTFYDHATGERTELSVTTYANWVAKTASLLADEYDLERGQAAPRSTCRRTGWARCSSAPPGRSGLVVTDGRRRRRGRLRPRTRSTRGPRGPRPPGARLRLQPARHPVRRAAAGRRARRRRSRSGPSPTPSSPCDPPGADDLAARRHQPARAVGAAAAGSLLTDGGRLLTEANPASPSGLPSFTEPLVRGGSLVLVAHADPGRLEATYAAERATARPLTRVDRRLSRPGRSHPSLPPRNRRGWNPVAVPEREQVAGACPRTIRSAWPVRSSR